MAVGLLSAGVVVAAPLPYWWPVLTGAATSGTDAAVLVSLVGWGVGSLLGVGLGLVGVPASAAAAAWALWPSPRWGPFVAATGGVALSASAVVVGANSAMAWALATGMGAAVWAAGGA